MALANAIFVVSSSVMEDFVIPVSETAADAGRPTVLLADDDAGVLKAISRTLATDFQIVATAADGQEALNGVLRLDPDVVVLDISMPRLNGFQTAAELRRLGSRAKIVFLTMHQDDDFVANAIRFGATGYVLKTLAWSDLIPALRHALCGRQQLPSLAPLVTTGADLHAVHFHGDDTSWLDATANVLIAALRRGDIVATALVQANGDALALRMNAQGWNVADLRARHLYVVFDAEEAATQVLRAGRANVDAVAEMVATLENARTASAAGRRAHLTLVGEIAAVLCRRGNSEAALDLERMWDDVTRSLPIFTICAYPTDCVDGDGAPGWIAGIAARHSAISHAASV